MCNSLQKGGKNCTSLCNSIVCPKLPLIKYSLLQRTDSHVGKMTSLISSLLLRCCGLARRAYKRTWTKRWKCFKLKCLLETEQVPWIHHYLAIYAISNKKQRKCLAHFIASLLAPVVIEGRCFNSAAVDQQPIISVRHYLGAIPSRTTEKKSHMTQHTDSALQPQHAYFLNGSAAFKRMNSN